MLTLEFTALRGNVKKKKSLFKDIIHIGGWVVKAFSKEETTVRVGCTHEMSTAHTPSVLGVES